MDLGPTLTAETEHTPCWMLPRAPVGGLLGPDIHRSFSVLEAPLPRSPLASHPGRHDQPVLQQKELKLKEG